MIILVAASALGMAGLGYFAYQAMVFAQAQIQAAAAAQAAAAMTPIHHCLPIIFKLIGM